MYRKFKNSTKVISVILIGISVFFSFIVIESNVNFPLIEKNIPLYEDIKVKTAAEQDLYPEVFFYNNEEIPQGADFTPIKVLVDPHDNIYISGSLYWASNGTNGMLLAKLDNKGIPMWQRIIIGLDMGDLPAVADMVIDSNENLYIAAYAGSSIDKIYLFKYNASGNLKWNQTWDPEVGTMAHEMAIDEFDNIYIVGYKYKVSNQNEICIIKYNVAGNELWNVTYGGPDSENGLDIAISEFGNIYVLGSTNSFGLGFRDAWFFEINSNGNMLWNKTFGTTSSDFPSEIVVDSLSNIYIQMVLDYKFDIFKFSPSGDYISNSSLSRSSNPINPKYEEMLIRDDSIYVLREGRISKFNTSCAFLWRTDQYSIRSISLDSKNNIYAAGKYDDWFIMKLTSTPYITIDNPYENQIFTHQAPQFNLTILEPDIFGAWYSLDNGLMNFSIDGTDGVIDQEEWESLNDGYITINFFVNDSLGNMGQKDIIVFKDTEAPSIIVFKPIQNSTYGSIPPNYSVLLSGHNIEYGDDVDSCWYYIAELKERINIPISGGLDDINGTINSASWNHVPEGEVNIRFGVKDVFGNERYVNIKLQKKLPRQEPLDPMILTIYIGTIVGIAVIAITVLIIRERKKKM